MRKEFIHVIRDPRSLYLAIGLPIVLLILFGYGITFEVNHIPVAVVNMDDSSLGRDLISRVQSSEYFDLLYLSNSYSGLEKLLDEGKVKIILVIPSYFSRSISKGHNTPLQFLIDGSDNNTALIALSYISRIVQDFSSHLFWEGLNKQGTFLIKEIPPIETRTRVWYNPNLRSTNL